MPTSLVTGGAGFIGSHLVAALLADGDRVRVLDNFSTGKPANLSGLQGPLEIIEGDLRDPNRVAEAVQGVDRIFHQAAFVSVPGSIHDPHICFETNVQGTFNLLEAARTAGVPRLVLASSSAVYGDSESLPAREDLPVRPLSPYAASKAVNELYVRLYNRVDGMEIVALRYFNVYGPRQSPDSDYAAAIPIFIRRMGTGVPATIYGDGHQVRDFIYVADVVRANLLAADCSEAGGSALNVCTGVEISVLDLVAVLGEILGFSDPPRHEDPRPGDIYRSFGDPEQAARVLGFRARTGLKEGLAETVSRGHT